MRNRSLLTSLARAFLAGEPDIDQVFTRASRLLGRRWHWLRPLARRFVMAFADRPRPRQRDVVLFLLHDPDFKHAREKDFKELSVRQWLIGPQQMLPVAAAETWDVPAIGSIGALADWLQLTPGELQWFADLKALGYKRRDCPQLQHYHYKVVSKRSGSIRLIESPKPRLKELQRQILARILDRIPAHPAVHGFCRGRSIKTFAASHTGRRVVLRMDLQDFFPSITGARVQALFRTAGYPESVADLLGGICTNVVPRDVWKEPAHEIDLRQLWEARVLFSRPHLPQGAPTSPALANLCTYRIDCRLAGLAKSANAEYTRYADDLAFSGGHEFERSVERFSTQVAAILSEEGFAINHRKTRIMRQGVRQHLAGLVINQRVNVTRSGFDCLKATLTNCVRLGPESQNRENHPSFQAHLEGRIGFVEMINPAKAIRLRRIFERIQWTGMESQRER